MGHKKRNITPRSKQSPAASLSADGPTIPDAEPTSASIVLKVEALDEPVGSSLSSAKLECERALTALRRGNHTKALRLMKESCSRYENSPHSALIHRVQGTVCIKVASIIDDLNAKQRHLRNAIESARRAVELSPNSVEFAHFYANLLFDAANEAKEYEEVVAECERALSIEHPIDPAKESLQEESQQRLMTAEARIGHMQGELKNLIQKSNFASISTWMKNLGGDEKFRLIPIRRATEDPMELRLVQTRRPNEIKKATKTPEERRKEIEVRVAAARLLQQQKSEAAGSPNEGGDKGLDTPGSGVRSSNDRRKHGKKINSLAERKDLVVRSYWSSLSDETKKQWLSIRVSDLNAHYGKLKEALANEVISEAVEHAEANKAWSFWVCSRCNEKLSDAESHLHHVKQGHLGHILPKMEAMFPQSINDEWIEMIHNCSWKPLDVSAALDMLQNQHKCRDSHQAGDLSPGPKTEDFEEAFKDAWDSSPEKDYTGDSFSSGLTSLESNDPVRNTSSGSSGQNENHAPLAYSPPDKWPSSDDPERARLLDRIHTILEALIAHKCLSAIHLKTVLRFTMDELQGLNAGSHLLSEGVNCSPICVCFLATNPLKKILKFLQEVSNSCGLGRYPEKNTSPMHNMNITNQSREINERIILSEDTSCILLDEALLSTVCSHSAMHKSTEYDVTGPNSGKATSDTNALLEWIFSGPSSGTEQLETWGHRREEKAQQHSETFEMFEKELDSLQNLLERKSELVGYEEALHVLEDLCFEEVKSKENGEGSTLRNYEAVLRRREEDLERDEYDDVSSSSRYEAEAVKNVLREARDMSANQFGDEDAYGTPSSHLRDLESGEYDDGRTKENLQQMDACIEVTMQKQKEESSMEICKIDARMMRTITKLQQLECKIDAASALDYRWILVPLIKSYMRTRLEVLAKEDAIEKSDAAREAFLAELALDSSKGSRNGNDSSKHGNDKIKDKKRLKEHRKMKDSKASGIGEQYPYSPEIDEPDSFTVSSDGDRPDSEPLASMHSDGLKEQEEELRRMELEAEERKLEETLEYQRRLENEAKLRQLAEQQKRHNQTQLERTIEEASDMKEPTTDNHDKIEQLELSYQRSDSLDVESALPIPSGSLVIVGIPKTGNNDHTELQKGMPDNGFPQDGVILSDRRTGRRGRRHKSSTKMMEEKSVASFGKENTGIATLEGLSHDNARADETLRKMHTQEDEERFQADLKQAVRQSLDAFQAHQKFPSPSYAVHGAPRGANNGSLTPSEAATVMIDGSDALGAGLQNDVGEYNCFLNVIIQSLWHLRRFRDEFLKKSTSDHVHVGDPCVTCALYEVFHALSLASSESRKEAVAPTSLRIALSTLYPDSNFFQKGQMNDASEVLGVIFDCLHKSFMQPSNASDNESAEGYSKGSWDCKDSNCLVHSLFGMDIFERMNCYSCGLESRHLKYTSFFHNINANALRTTKLMSAESSFDGLLDLVERNHQRACDPESGGCGKLNHTHHFLLSPPHVFTTVLGWQKTRETAGDIAATLAALSTEIDMSVLYRGLDPKLIHSLVSVVCYYGQHYHCFAYSHDHDRWIMYDDTNVKVVGSWADVLTMCEKGHLQPQVLFFEATK